MSGKTKGFDFIVKISDHCRNSNGFDRVLRMIKMVDGGNGRAVGEFTVCPEHCNRQGTLHGGLISTILDNVTTYAMMSKGSHPGVTANLSVSFLAPAKLGEVVQIEANTVRAGKKMAYLDCVFKLKSDGRILAKGGQVKYIQFDDEKINYKKF
ncbi:acyl-coenzyme A thioesterase 13-like [Drosophila bipectinata]|uniref:acyl-coenzyme A thioesterase 13-like n=1 Tax=Drosophila bipectinata TaxID=42026 RepID=UPI0007E79D17|nr:acyl-coenzyme A thioesterase 13-like [Drosophila bipectinata]